MQFIHRIKSICKDKQKWKEKKNTEAVEDEGGGWEMEDTKEGREVGSRNLIYRHEHRKN